MGRWPKSYEVHCQQNGRWHIDATLDSKKDAESLAKELFGRTGIEAVKVMEDRNGKQGDMVFLRESQRSDVPKLGHITDAPFCTRLMDLYTAPARRTIGRLLRNQLDKQGIMPIEFIHDPNALGTLKHQESLWLQGCRKVADIQCKDNKDDAGERFENLLLMADEVYERAKDRPEADKLANILAEKGYDAAQAACDSDWSEEYRVLALGGAWAQLMKKAGSPSHKAEIILGILSKDGNPETQAVCDEMMAELLESPVALKEIFGHHDHLADALLAMGEMARSSELPLSQRQKDAALGKLNRVLMHDPCPKTREALLRKIEVGLRSVKPLTLNRDGESGKLYQITATLFRPWGLAGGGAMAGAVLRRSRSVLGSEGQDLGLADTIQSLIILFPSAGSRLGFLLTLGTDPYFTDSDNVPLLTKVLAEAILAIPDHHALISAKDTTSSADEVADRLRITGQSFPYWKHISPEAQKHFVLLAGGASTAQTMGEGASKTATKDSKTRIEPGDYLFKQGEAGDAAYLITSGLVDILTEAGGPEHLIATVGQGEIVGEMALVDNSPRMASARARTKVATIAVPQAALRRRLDALEQNNSVLRKLVDTWIKRLRQ